MTANLLRSGQGYESPEWEEKLEEEEVVITPYQIFKKMSEILPWAKKQFPGRSFNLQHREGNQYAIVVKRRGKMPRQVVYVQWDKEEEA